MEQNTTDQVMRFVLKGRDVWAECVLQIAPNDILMNDFTRDPDYDCYTNFFEVTNFDFSVAMKDTSESTNVIGNQHTHTLGSNPARNHQPLQQKSSANKTFARWRSATTNQVKDLAKYYPLEFDQFNFKRVIDRASPTFFKSCCDSTSFDKAVLVKRLSQGDLGGSMKPSIAYLRIEFTEVLITGVSWDDGDLVTESCEFICRGMTITYRQQAPSGSLSSMDKDAWGSTSTSSARWPDPTDDRTLGIRRGGRG
jgi:type VI protein secretion system component Hcp